MELDQLMETEIQKLYDTEVQLMQGLEFMGGMVQNEQLRTALEEHRTQSEEHVRRLEQICEMQGWQTGGQTSMVTQALIQEAQEMLQGQAPSAAADAMLIGAQQKAEHLEIACYGTARTLAMQMGNQEAARLLEQTLQEEKETDQRLTQIAESGVNQEAAQQGGASMM